ncbi:hypothetical protein ACIBH1_07640 [Nonomuraea sp. NPDC050663]|uniref:hypothetical protein n=1 Tax=Nonomuraea sp. NPDC050663 TaxID=3364370 RepID=UPI0037B44EDF
MTNETDLTVRGTARALITAAFTGEKELLDYVFDTIADDVDLPSLADHVIDLHVMIVGIISDEPGLRGIAASDDPPVRPDHDLMSELLVLAFYSAELLRMRFSDEAVAWKELRSLLLLDADQD